MNCLERNALLFITLEFLRKGNVWELPEHLPPTPRLGQLEKIIHFIPKTEAIRWLLAVSQMPDALEVDKKRARIALARCFGYTGSRNGHGV